MRLLRFRGRSETDVSDADTLDLSGDVVIDDTFPDDTPSHTAEMPSGERLDDGALFWGFLMGVVAGTLYLLPRLPQRAVTARGSVAHSSTALRERLDSPDPVQTSLQTGRDIARRQRRARHVAADGESE